MAAWRFYTLDAVTLTVRDELDLGNVTITDRLKGVGALSAGMPQHSPKATRANLDTENTVIAAERDGRVLFAGPLLEVGRNEGAGQLSLLAESPWHWVRRRKLRSVASMSHATFNAVERQIRWAGVDQFRIVADMITHLRNIPGGNIPISVHWDALSGQVRDRSYDSQTARMVGELIEDLANVQGGFDWILDPVGGVDALAWELWLYHPRRARETVYEWSLDPSGTRNVIDYALYESSRQRVQRFVAVGQGEGADQLVSVVEDASLLGVLPLVEGQGAWVDVSRANTLLSHAQRALSLDRRAARTPQLITDPAAEPRLSTYRLGDIVDVRIDDGWAQINSRFRIVGRTIRLEGEAETVAIELAPVERGT
ncbi:MAG: hypothetical protein ACXIVQ_12280 [Acidimicrobiales bacterium]